MTTTPRVDALIERVMDEHPSVGRAYYEAVHQELAPLARELERESALLRNDIARLRKVVAGGRGDALQQHGSGRASIRRGASRLGG